MLDDVGVVLVFGFGYFGFEIESFGFSFEVLLAKRIWPASRNTVWALCMGLVIGNSQPQQTVQHFSMFE